MRSNPLRSESFPLVLPGQAGPCRNFTCCECFYKKLFDFLGLKWVKVLGQNKEFCSRFLCDIFGGFSRMEYLASAMVFVQKISRGGTSKDRRHRGIRGAKSAL